MYRSSFSRSISHLSEREIWASQFSFEMDSKASASTSSLPGGEYEVFLSFSVPDARYTFTDFLYTNLEGAGVRTFLDDNELRMGEEIGPELLKVITQSKISIPIFSKTYASSKWCLHELAQMVECMRTTGQLILPIFHDVEPSEVQHQSGSYEEAFREHESCFNESIIKDWKEALREVGALKGWEVKKEADGDQGKLVKMIVQTVLLELKKNCMVLTDNLVGINYHAHQMMRLLKVASNDTRIVGIHGMGGIGKTTIAKWMYKKLIKYFECCSFLADIRETAQQHKSLVSLQKQLLASSTPKSCHDIVDVDGGINIIKQRFLKKKVLIVLDDLSEKYQFDCLVGNHNWFGPGSRILITTRDKHALNAIQVNEEYEPPFMNSVQSLQLFSMHAFRRKFPPKDYDDISRKVASTAAGLPLTLEVIGSFLSDKTKVVWEDTLKKLKKIPADQVQKRLRISYDELNHEQQQIFLDIACLFIGMDKTHAFYMWDDCGFYPEMGIKVLCFMSLVKMGDDNVLRMHDQLRDLGREIVRQEDLKNPGAHSRLWDQEEALDVLKGCKGTEKVNVLSVHFSKEMAQSDLTSEEFAKLYNLRYLQVNRVKISGDFKQHLSQLRWLCWTYCPLEFKATNFHTKNLVILDVSNSFVTEKWKGWSQIKETNKLKVLVLANCDLSRIPYFSSYVNLEILDLKGCGNFVKINPSIGNMKNLKVLKISMTLIKKLPDEIWMLEKLEVLDASYCNALEGNIPSCVERLSSLRELKFDCTKIQSLPTSICKLSCLQTLDLKDCEELQALPDLPSSLEILRADCPKPRELLVTPNLVNLINLKELRFSWCIRTLPKEMGAFSQLEILTINYCNDLQCILGLPSSLVVLSIESCPSLEILPDLSNLKNLLELELKHCDKLMEIQGLGGQESLKRLHIEGCDTLKEIQVLGNLKSLESLHIEDCDMLKRVQGLGSLKSLRSLSIIWCEKIATLNLLERLASLPSLEMNEYKHLGNKSARSNLNKLKTLDVSDCTKLKKIQGLDRLKSLEKLTLTGCKSIVRLPNLSNLKMLRCLQLNECTRLREIEGREALEARLEELDVRECTSLEQAPHLLNPNIRRQNSGNGLTQALLFMLFIGTLSMIMNIRKGKWPRENNQNISFLEDHQKLEK
ncbi:disease resistance protein L6-like isoform X2 [Cornus florida]|uniref:disease resistance protein L6-like isoform X2 n=1 Tax=Cornus florida TaxID=4283 RepID=UPI002899706D|nr:disease resistance protein L6-like isoform X2 [Cornus florida]XP_059641005.1 disease resistance protein L6-like isoform X2 [Cornus florida]XP_059641006.1 disease resistance protein L6-like isoform X2 [Cornus florida]